MKQNGSSKQGKKRGGIIHFITGDILLWWRKWYPLAIYCCLLVFAYIVLNFHHQRLQREEISARLELNKERSRAVVFSSIRMNNSRPSYIMEQVRERGIELEESQQPPKKLTRDNGD